MKFSNKLFFAIFITGLIALVILSFAIYKYNYDSMIASQSMYTKSIANEISGDIDHLLLEKVKTALTLANTPIIKQALEKNIVFYADLSDEKRKESIKFLNEQWKSTKNPEDNFILKFTDNKVSHFLKNQQKVLKGEYGEIFLTNKFGALVASTSKLSTFSHGHKYWWLGAYNNGEGAVFFDDRGYDDSVSGYVLGLVVPVKKGTEIIGILKCNLNIIGSINEMISGAEDKLIGKFKLVRSGGMVVFEEGFEPLSTKVHDDIFQKLKSNNQRTVIINDSGEKYLVGFAQIKLTKDEKGYVFGGRFESIDHKKGNTGESWYILCYRQMSIVRAPIIESMEWVAVISTSIILILGLVSYLFGRKIARPLAILEKATKQIGKGDFKYRIDLWQKDEFGSLADSFNNMAARLQQTTTSIELFENELAERKLAEEQLLEKEETLKVITESTNDAIIIMNNRGIITFWNTAASNMLRYSKEEALGENLHESIVPERFLNAHLSAFPQFIKTGKGNAIGTTLELYAIGKDHIEIPVELSLSSIMIEGEWFAVGIMRDNTERKKMEEELRRLATIDSLTNINNRRYFLDLALKEMDRSKRYGHPFSLIMLDIDHFKKVNDTYGHSVGDQVLIDFCDTCMKEFRESDFMGRLGGEEFAVAIVECDLEGAAILAERIREAVASHTVVIGNEEIRFTVSIGITRMWQDCDLNSMIESADNALYKAKNNGRNQVQFAEIKPV